MTMRMRKHDEGEIVREKKEVRKDGEKKSVSSLWSCHYQ